VIPGSFAELGRQLCVGDVLSHARDPMPLLWADVEKLRLLTRKAILMEYRLAQLCNLMCIPVVAARIGG
jgi:hypothetical protein